MWFSGSIELMYQPYTCPRAERVQPAAEPGGAMADGVLHRLGAGSAAATPPRPSVTCRPGATTPGMPRRRPRAVRGGRWRWIWSRRPSPPAAPDLCRCRRGGCRRRWWRPYPWWRPPYRSELQVRWKTENDGITIHDQDQAHSCKSVAAHERIDT